MDLLACVDLPALPLQLLLQGHPEWAGLPAAVVDEDKPQGRVLWSNQRAREAGVLPGLRYGPALSLAPQLRAGTITGEAIQAGVGVLTDRLRGFSPGVEPSEHEPGVFWLDAHGLQHLYASPGAWAIALREDLRTAGFVAAVVVGFRRFGTYAAVRAFAGRGVHVFGSPEEEDAAMREVPLARVGLPPGVRDALAKLGIARVGDLLGLPAHGLGRRFGPEALALWRFASGEHEVPLQPLAAVVPVEEALELGYGEANAERLVFMIKPLVDRLLIRLGLQGQALLELTLRLALDGAPERLERIRTAEPTLAPRVVMELVQLRLAAAPLQAPALSLVAGCVSVAATPEQLRMFMEAPRRDPKAASRAFARLRAAFGREDVVVTAALADRHTPEARFAWVPLHTLVPAEPGLPGEPTLVRRLFTKPTPLPDEPSRGDGWLLAGVAAGPVTRLTGPYRLAGGWWQRGLERDYYFAELQRGELLWVYYDGRRRGWYLQGEIS